MIRRERRRPILEPRPAQCLPNVHRTAMQVLDFLPVSRILRAFIQDAAKANGIARFDTFHDCVPVMSPLSHMPASIRVILGLNTPLPRLHSRLSSHDCFEVGAVCQPTSHILHSSQRKTSHLAQPPRDLLEPGSCIVEQFQKKS